MWPLALVGVAAAQAQPEKTDRFDLFTGCKSLAVLVEGMEAAEADIGLTEQMLHVAAESRLRAARLYAEKNDPYGPTLYVNALVIGPAYSVSVSLQKVVRDQSGSVGEATTWDSAGAGTHGRDPLSILSHVSEYLDRFMAAYLRVNQEACGG